MAWCMASSFQNNRVGEQWCERCVKVKKRALIRGSPKNNQGQKIIDTVVYIEELTKIKYYFMKCQDRVLLIVCPSTYSDARVNHSCRVGCHG